MQLNRTQHGPLDREFWREPYCPTPAKMDTVFGNSVANIGVPVSALLGIVFAVFLWQRVSNIKVRGGVSRGEDGRSYLLEEEQRGESEASGLCAAPVCGPAAADRGYQLATLDHAADHTPLLQIEEKAADLQAAISEGANSFLFTEYKYVSIFMVSDPG